ncbi:50S ribosomal protein L5 [Candidatus Woesearchaeota archaeon]|nr:50S ribosomal protein L5 [Candidatus Woesearchaeota archaeon]
MDNKAGDTNSMRKIRIEKITLNVGAGKDAQKLEKGAILIKHITGIEPVKTVTNKRIATWGIRPGLPIGCKLTIRTDLKREILEKLLKAKENVLKESNFDNNGNISFGIHEYIDIPGIEYKPEVGIMGFQICITLERPGFRVKKRSIRNKCLKKTHKISKKEAIEFMKDEFSVRLEE